MTDAHLMDADCTHGNTWYECPTCEENMDTATACPIRPLTDRVVVQLDDPETMTPSGLHLPAVAQDKPIIGTAVAVGRGAVTADGKIVPLEIIEGDRVLVSRFGGVEVDVLGRQYLVLHERDVLGVIEGD